MDTITHTRDGSQTANKPKRHIISATHPTYARMRTQAAPTSYVLFVFLSLDAEDEQDVVAAP